MTTLGNPLTGLFSFLNGTGSSTGNGFGISGGALLASTGEGGASSFARLIGDDEPLLPSLLTVTTSPKITKPVKIEEDSQDLSSPDLLLSDLLALNFNNIEPGEVINLPNGYKLTASDSGFFILENETLGITTEPFSIIEIQTLLQPFIAATQSDIITIDLNEKPIAPESKTSSDRLGLRTDAVDQDGIIIDNAINVVDDRTEELVNKSSKINIADLITSTKQGAENTTNNAALGGSSAQNNIQTSNKPIAQKTIDSIKNIGRDSASVLLPSVFVHQFNELLTPSTEDISIANNSFYHQFGLKDSGTGALTGSTPLTPQQLQIVIQRLVKNGETKSLSVRLDPAELGRVQVDLSTTQNKGLRVHVLVEKAETLQILKHDLSSLEKALQNAGLSIEDGTVTFDLSNSDDQNGSFAQQAFQELWKERNAQNLPAQISSIDETGTIDAMDIISQIYTADGRINIKV